MGDGRWREGEGVGDGRRGRGCKMDGCLVCEESLP